MMAPTFSQCPQCGLYHPPITDPSGKCPMAKVKDNQGNEIKFEKLFADLKNICTSQIQKKNLKDHNKLFSFVIVKLTKILEEYNE